MFKQIVVAGSFVIAATGEPLVKMVERIYPQIVLKIVGVMAEHPHVDTGVSTPSEIRPVVTTSVSSGYIGLGVYYPALGERIGEQPI
jgi:hypothetical protein